MKLILGLLVGFMLIGPGCQGKATDGGDGQEETSQQAASSSSPMPDRKGPPADAVRLSPSAIMDPGGFGRPMVASTLFVPHGWKPQGGIVWSQEHACTNGYAINWSAESPDGLSAMAILPQQQWEWNQDGRPSNPACPIMQIDGAPGYIRAVISHGMPDARIVDMQPRQDLEREFSAMTGVQDDGFQRMEVSVQVAEAAFEFSKDGTKLQGRLVAAVSLTRIRTGGSGYGYGAPIETMLGFAFPAFASYGPPESYDPAFFEGLRRSFVSNPAWDQQIAQHNSTMGKIAQKGMLDRANIRNQANADISKMRNEAWQNQQKSADVRAQEFIKHIRDVTTYADPSATGGSVDLSSMYDNAWRMDDGSYVMSSDPGFDPQQLYGLTGKRLSPAK